MNLREKRKKITGVWQDKEGRYAAWTAESKPYWLLSDESPAVTERLEHLVAQVEQALPKILSLTNQLGAALNHGANLTSNLNHLALEVRPAVSNLSAATARLDQPGALGEWLLPTNLNSHLAGTLESAQSALAAANTNLAAMAKNLERSLDHLAGITGNLNAQVQANTNLVTAVSDAIIHADQFIQGLKRHWLFRSAFKQSAAPSRGAPPANEPLRSPKAEGVRPAPRALEPGAGPEPANPAPASPSLDSPKANP